MNSNRIKNRIFCFERDHPQIIRSLSPSVQIEFQKSILEIKNSCKLFKRLHKKMHKNDHYEILTT